MRLAHVQLDEARLPRLEQQRHETVILAVEGREGRISRVSLAVSVLLKGWGKAKVSEQAALGAGVHRGHAVGTGHEFRPDECLDSVEVAPEKLQARVAARVGGELMQGRRIQAAPVDGEVQGDRVGLRERKAARASILAALKNKGAEGISGPCLKDNRRTLRRQGNLRLMQASTRTVLNGT